MILTAASIPTDPLSLLVSLGPGGAVAFLFAAGWLVTKAAYQAALKERDDARAELAKAQAALLARQDAFMPRADYQACKDELDKLRNKLEDIMIPGVFRATDTLSQTLTVLSRLADRAPV